jgi:lactate dehydrogenase (NAD+,ferredoxin) subunit LctD
MSPFKPVNTRILERLAAVLGPSRVTSDPDIVSGYSHDEFSLREIARNPDVVVKPETTGEVAAVLRLAGEERIPVTPRGGATGLCGGCVPVLGGIVLSLEKMNRVEEVDAANQMAVTQAGVTLGEFSRAVEDAGLYFPPHPGDESAMMGGLIATNAGGSRAVKYGGIRNYVRGLEVVSARGDVLHLGGKLVKSSTGYSLLQLFIGSEGTLGIITRATIQLMTKPAFLRTLVIPFTSLEQAVETVPLLLERGVLPMAVEFLERDVIHITEEHLQKHWPAREGTDHLFVILDAATEEEIDRLSQQVAGICLERGGLDVFVSDTPAKQEEVLAIRSKIYEALKRETVEILDISVPRAAIAGHVRFVREVARRHNVWLPTFGHAGDGNVHTHIMKARYEDGRVAPVPETEWRKSADAIRDELIRDAIARGGVVSGEHGIGLVKKPYLPLNLGPAEIELMRGLKRVFDPEGILNPGKIFD